MALAAELKRALGRLRQELCSASNAGERLQLLQGGVLLLEKYPEKEAVPIVEEAVNRAAVAADIHLMTAGLWILAEHARRCGDCTVAVGYASRLLDAARRAENCETEGIALLLDGRILEHCGKFADARECYERALDLWCKSGSADGRRAALNSLCALMLQQGLPSAALKFCQEALEIDPSGQSRSEQAAMFLNMGLGFVQTGDWEAAAEHMFRSVAIAEKHGLNAILLRAFNALGEMFLRRDRPERAIEFFSRVVQASCRAETDVMCGGLAGLVAACYANGDLAAAELALRDGFAHCERLGDLSMRASLHRLAAELALAKGRAADAESSAQKALEIAQRGGVRREVGRVLGVLGQIAADRKDTNAAVTFFEQALSSLEGTEDHYDLGRVRLQYGRMLVNAGRASEAAAQLTAAEHIFRDLGIASQIAESSRLLFKVATPEGSDLVLLAAVAGLAALRLDPTCFLERALRLVRDGLGFESAAIVTGERALVVCGEPSLERAFGLCRDDDVPRVSETTICFPVRFDGKTLAWVYLEKGTRAGVAVQPLLLQGLASMLARQVREFAAVTEKAGSRGQVIPGLNYKGVVGRNPGVLRALEVVAKVASTPIPVLIRGENGTGKELIARALHDSGSRSNKPFVAVNCAAVPETLLEAEFFGVAKGAATGVSPRKGKFELANGGSIFLDEIGDMSPVLQAKLLRVLHEKCFERVGGNQLITVDVRVIAATNQNLEDRMERGLFRRDLYYRLNGVEIEVPALRERKEDIPDLVRYFVDRSCRELGRQITGVNAEAMRALMEYDWPGNIRELQNVIERAVVLCKENELSLCDLPVELCKCAPTEEDGSMPSAGSDYRNLRSAGRQARSRAVSAFERTMIVDCLNRANWNISKAAELAGYSRAQFYRLLRKHNISRP